MTNEDPGHCTPNRLNTAKRPDRTAHSRPTTPRGPTCSTMSGRRHARSAGHDDPAARQLLVGAPKCLAAEPLDHLRYEDEHVSTPSSSPRPLNSGVSSYTTPVSPVLHSGSGPYKVPCPEVWGLPSSTGCPVIGGRDGVRSALRP